MELEHSFTVPVPRAQAWDVLLDVERIAPCMPGATLEHSDGDSFGGRVKVKVGPIQVIYTGKAHFVERDDNAYVAVIDATGKESRGSGTVKATIRCALHDEGAAATKVAVTTDLSITGKPAQFGRGVMADVGNKIIGQFAACLAEEITDPAGVPGTAAVASAGEAGTGGAGGAGTGGASGEGTGGAEGGAQPSDPMASDPAGLRGTDAPAGIADPDAVVPAGAAAAAGLAAPVGASAPQGNNLPYVGPLTTPPRRSAEAIDLLDTAGLPVLKRLGPALGLLAALVVLWRLATRRRRQ